jgi:hypothetical protein
MREGFDKEIDSLLRRRARSLTEVRSDGDGAPEQGGGAHLDADELNAFAEGALPAQARNAVASHLADCERCRGVVVGLARATGFEVASERRAAVAEGSEVAGVAGWRAWLSSLLSPRSLRYASAALALCVVGVVSYVALYTRTGSGRNGAQVALSERRRTEDAKEAAGAAASANTENANTGINMNAEGTLGRADEASRAASVNASAQPQAGRGHGAAEIPLAPSEVASEAAGSAPAPGPPPAAKSDARDEVAAAAPKATPAGEQEVAKSESKDKSARAAEPAEEGAALDQPSQQKRANQQARMNEVQMPDGSRSRAAGNTQSNTAGVGGAAPATRAEDRDSAATRGPEARRGRSAALAREKGEDDETVRVGETRDAAGHRFRRVGGAWVDVNYKPSMSSTGVRRGTESFRALVADLPEIGRVAEQIGGEVIVVIHGRAYHIR